MSISHSSPRQNQLTLPSRSPCIFRTSRPSSIRLDIPATDAPLGRKFETLCMLRDCPAMLLCLSGQGMSPVCQTSSFVSLIIFHDLGTLSGAFPKVSIQLGRTIFVSGVQDRQRFGPSALGVSTASSARLGRYSTRWGHYHSHQTEVRPLYTIYVKLSPLTTTHSTGMLSHANPALNSTVELPDEL